jgi:hypothetical protein
MIFASTILLRIFEADELKGHYVCGKVISKCVKHKKPLLDKRALYIKWLVESHFDALSKEDLWQLCRRSINKTILNIERKGFSKDSIKIELPESQFVRVENVDDDDELEGINTNKLETAPDRIRSSYLI